MQAQKPRGKEGNPEEKTKLKEVLRYVLSLSKSTGGFAYAKTIPPGIEDTYFAIRTLEAIGYRGGHHATTRWLRREPWIPDPTGRVLYFRIALHLRLGIEVPWEMIKEEITRFLPKLQGNPQKLDFLGRITAMARKHHRAWGEIETLLEGEAYKANLSISPKDTLQKLWRKYRVHVQYRRPLDLLSLSTFLKLSQNPDGGFGCKPHTTSFLEHTYFAYRLFAELRMDPPNKEVTKAFILNCQSKRGGFARAPGGVPFLDTTFYGIRVLEMLEGYCPLEP